MAIGNQARRGTMSSKGRFATGVLHRRSSNLHKQNRNGRVLLTILPAFLLFSLHDASVKLLDTEPPVSQILFVCSRSREMRLSDLAPPPMPMVKWNDILGWLGSIPAIFVANRLRELVGRQTPPHW